METISVEKELEDAKVEEKSDIQNEEKVENEPQRQDFTSDSNKIEIYNLAKFCFAVSRKFSFLNRFS